MNRQDDARNMWPIPIFAKPSSLPNTPFAPSTFARIGVGALAALLFVVVSSYRPAYAADADAERGPGALTLVAAVQQALVRAPSLTLAALEVEEATIVFREAELGQIVGNPRREYEQARQSLQDKRAAYTDELVQVALQVEEAYHKVLSTKEIVTIQGSNQEQAERVFALAKARFEAGLIARQDFLEAELSYEQTLHSLEVGRRQHEDAQRQLRRFVGLDDEMPLVLQDEFPFEPWHIGLEVALNEALAGRAEIVRARRAVEQAELQVHQADTPYAAPVDLRRAEITLARAEIQLAQIVNQIAEQVRNEWHALMDLQRDVDVASRQEQLALTRADISRARYDAGTIALLDLLQHEEAYARARLDAASTVWDYNVARARFLRTLGRSQLPPLPAVIAEYVDSWTAGSGEW